MILGRHDAAQTLRSAVRTGTVPTIVPFAYTVPPSCSVRSIAVPPVSAAESARKGTIFHAGPTLLNSSSDSPKKQPSFQYGSCKAGT